jgi:capsular polysaccharide biosynthesis protein
MELREYWRIVSRRLWLMVALLLVVLAASLLTQSVKGPRYVASSRFMVGLRPEPMAADCYAYDHYYTWLASEYLADDLAEVVIGASFAAEVEAETEAAGTHLSRSLEGAFRAQTRHRTLTLQIDWDDAEELVGIATAAVQVLGDRSSSYFAQIGDNDVEIRPVDPPSIVAVALGLREKLDLPLRLLLSLGAGIALVFLLHYLDDAVYDRGEVEDLGITVLAEIPPQPRGGRFLRRRHLP